MIVNILFWTSLILILHTYAIYPLLLVIAGKFLRRKEYHGPESYKPMVSVLMAVYNEENVIGDKIEALFLSDYPSELMEVIVGSDASDDGTEEILENIGHRHPGLRTVRFPERRGKPAVINDLSSMASGEILIITDANVFPSPDCIKNLVLSTSDKSVGLVDTRLLNTGIGVGGVSLPGAAYVSLETRIKNIEGRLWGMMMGPFGGFYAVRRSSFKPNSDNTLSDDFRICMNVILKGDKAISNMNAIAYEDVTDSLAGEFRRKVRISTGNFQNLRHFAFLLKNPFRKLSSIFISHKVLRWMAPFIWMILLPATILLASKSIFFTLILYLQLIFIILPPLDLLLRRIGLNIVPLRFFTHLFLMNLALIAGFIKYLNGVESGIWVPTKRFQ